jgi:TRAP-type C4-dicarboxylate transport system substrate-binding protein
MNEHLLLSICLLLILLSYYSKIKAAVKALFWRPAQEVAMGKFKVLYEVRLEDDDSVLEKGAVVVEADRDGAFPTAVKQVLNELKKRDRDVVYVACVAVQEAK